MIDTEEKLAPFLPQLSAARERQHDDAQVTWNVMADKVVRTPRPAPAGAFHSLASEWSAAGGAARVDARYHETLRFVRTGILLQGHVD